MGNGIEATFTNIFQFIAFLSPFLLSFFLIVSSIFNQDLKGFIYLAGLLITISINIILLNIIRHQSPDMASVCKLVDFNIFNKDSSFDSPNMSSVLIAFTLAYLFLPMHFNNPKQYNIIVILFILVILAIDTITKINNQCTQIGGAFIGIIVGLSLGSVWFTLFKSFNYNELLYFNSFISNNTICSKPSKQTFKCEVYKNGELIKNSIV